MDVKLQASHQALLINSLDNLLHAYFSSQKIGHKRVMLFTNNDNPHADDPALQVRLLFCIFGDATFATCVAFISKES